MLKGSLKIIVLLLLACNPVDEEKELEAYEQYLNKEAETTIDAAYISIQQHCDSLIRIRMALINDSLLANRKKKKK